MLSAAMTPITAAADACQQSGGPARSPRIGQAPPFQLQPRLKASDPL